MEAIEMLFYKLLRQGKSPYYLNQFFYRNKSIIPFFD